MSEATYELRQPVEIKIGLDWLKAAIFETSGQDGRHWCVYAKPDGTTRSDWFHPEKIRPDPDFVLASRTEPARSGWRLPEPGDVVRVKLAGYPFEYKVAFYKPNCATPVKLETPKMPSFSTDELELVRLHDEPAPTPDPEHKAEPEPAKVHPKDQGVTLDAATRNRCLDYLAALNLGFEQEVIDPNDQVAVLANELSLVMVDTIAKALGGPK